MYSLEWLIDEFERKIRHKFIFFWGHQKNVNREITASCLSQWYPANFVVDGVKFPTAEHWMMAQKALLFNDLECYEGVMNSKSPKEAKDWGRKVRNFDENIWNERRLEIVVKGNYAKFTQNWELENYLLNTNNKVLVEASPVDRIWGIGLTADSDKAKNPKLWNGLNLLGFALMEVREMIKNKN